MNGTYGFYCQQSCNCQNGASCQANNGLCHCTKGWMGPRCTDGKLFSSPEIIIYNIVSTVRRTTFGPVKNNENSGKLIMETLSV